MCYSYFISDTIKPSSQAFCADCQDIYQTNTDATFNMSRLFADENIKEISDEQLLELVSLLKILDKSTKDAIIYLIKTILYTEICMCLH